MIDRMYSLDKAPLAQLEACAGAEGFQIVRRLVDDYTSGANTFSRPGEALYCCRRNGIPIAVGGVNQEAIAQFSDAGRIRRVYVHPDARRSGVGTALICRIIEDARDHFEILTCNVGTKEAYGFYEKLGFRRVCVDGITHVYECT